MRALEFLVEYNRDITLQRYKDKLASAATQDRNQSVDEVISQLEEMDPTKNKQYVQWLVIQYIKGQFRTEDSHRVNALLTTFIKLKPRLDQKDINRYDFYQLDEKIDSVLNPELSNNNTSTSGTFPVIPNSEVLYNGPLGQLAIPETEEASCELGRGTKWCTAASENNQFKHYQDEPLYIWRDRNGEKYQFYFGFPMQLMDARDRPLSKEQLNYFRTKHPVLKKLFDQIKNKALKNPKIAWLYMEEIIKGRWPEGEKVIATDPEYSYMYAMDVIKGRWPEGEKAILQSPYYTYNYAKKIIKGRWPEGEKTITRDPETSWSYVETIIQGRWPAGEKAIASSPHYAYFYAKKIIQGRWPEGESSIAKDPVPAFNYAKYIIKGRWPEGEEAIAIGPWTAFYYAKFIIKGRWPDGEEAIASDPSPAYNYAKYVIKGRFPAGENAIKTNPQLWAEYTYLVK